MCFKSVGKNKLKDTYVNTRQRRTQGPQKASMLHKFLLGIINFIEIKLYLKSEQDKTVS